MATVTRENIGLLNEKIVVKVAKDDYLPSFEKAIKNYSKQANIPGFRKGMVPVGMVKKMYGSSVFADEVIKSVEKGLSDYMSTEKLEIFAQPLPLPENDSRQLDMNQPSEYAFAFEVGLKPSFSIPDLGTSQLTRYQVTVTDEMIDEEVNQLQARYGKMTDAETVTSEENELDVTFMESDAEGNAIEGGISLKKLLSVKYFTPLFRDQLIGKRNDDVVIVQLSTAFEGREREYILNELGLSKDVPQHIEKFFRILINKIESSEKPELNEAFFKQAFPDKEITSEADFRNVVKDQIQAQWDAQTRNQLLDQLYHELLNHTQIDFPQEFLKRWMQTGAEQQKTPEQVEQEYPTFANQLKWTLIIDKLVEENNIQVDPADIREFAKMQLVGYMGGNMIDINQPWVNDYIDKMMKDKKFIEDSFHRIRTDKVFNWAEGQIKPAPVMISSEDFIKIQEEHKHHH